MGKGQFFLLTWNYKENSLNKDIRTENFKKDLINLAIQQINMNTDHSVSRNNSFKSYLNAKSFNMFLTL